MAASAGTNPGSTPDGVGVGVGVTESLADGVGDSDGSGEEGPLTVALGVGFTADVEAQPPRTMAMATAAQTCAIRRAGVPPGMPIGRSWELRHARRKAATICAKQMPYAHSEDASSIRVALGTLLRRRREEAERSLSELAEAAELSPAYLSELERGLKDVSSERLLAIARALEIPVADLYLDLARSLGSREAIEQRRSWPDDPRTQLRIATQNLRPQALRSVAHFSLYLAATQATPPRRRIGFTVDR
jgi:transcriptional regulator with XRE-family HTH domain